MDIGEALDRLRADGTHETYPVASRSDVTKTEVALGRSLPDSYGTFVQEFSNGAYLYGTQEVSAVGDGNQQIMPIQKIYRSPVDPGESIPYREGGTTTYGNLIPFGLDSNGNEWCFVADVDTDGNEYPVAYFHTLGKKLFGRLPSFTDWLVRLIERREEVIRTMYGDDVLYEELELG
jgi:hypothetical protein